MDVLFRTPKPLVGESRNTVGPLSTGRQPRPADPDENETGRAGALQLATAKVDLIIIIFLMYCEANST